MFTRIRGWGLNFLRFFGICAVIGASWGWYNSAAVPRVAATNNIEIFDLLLRCVEFQSEYPLDPFHLLRGNPEIARGIVAIEVPFGEKVESITTQQKGPTEYVHTVKLRRGGTHTVTTTTPHLTVPAAELAKARRQAESLYPRSEAESWSQLQQWGTALLLLNWERRNDLDAVPEKVIMPPVEGTEEEHLWLIWQVLSAGQPGLFADLPRLPELLRASYPQEAEQQVALQWARTFLQRLRDNAEDHQKGHAVHLESSGGTERRRFLQKARIWVPPDNATTYHWLLAQYVGLSDYSKSVVQERWLSYFPASKRSRVLAWGRQLEAERRQAGEPLPPSGDNVALLCVLERYLGTDAYGQRCRTAYRTQWPASQRMSLSGYAQIAYPTDDFFYLAAAGDPLHLHSDGRVPLILHIGIILLVMYGFRFVIFNLLAEKVLGLKDNPIYVAYHTGRSHGSVRGWLVGYLVVPVVAWILASFTISEQLDLLIPDSWRLFVGVYASVLLGGLLLGICTRLLAVVLIAARIDINRVWLDEVLGIVLGASLLYYFGNDLLSIGSYAAFEMLPMFLDQQPKKLSPAP